MLPPRLLTWLLTRVIPTSLQEPVLGDLAESYARRARLDGRGAAARQYLREGWAAFRSLGALSDEPTSLTPPRSPVDGLGADVRFALRLHARRPAATAVVLLTLGLAIGASTAIYSVVKPTLLDALPYPTGSRLALIWERDEGGLTNVGYATFADLRDQTKSFDQLAAIGYWSPTWLGISDPARLAGQSVSASFFGILGVPPALGRDFGPTDDQPGAERVAIVSHRLWRERMGANPAAIGQAMSLDGYPYTVVGVLPENFESLLSAAIDIWRPLRYDVSLDYACRDCRHLRALGRLAPGKSFGAATGEIGQVAARLKAEFPAVYGDLGMAVEPLKTYLTKGSRTALALLFAAVAMVLGIACVNVANLLLSQAVQRRHEFAVRMAVGSGRERLLRQVLLESMMLGLGGAVVAGLLTWMFLGPIRSAAATLPRASAVVLDWQVFLFGGAVGLIAGVAFGLLPALSSLESANQGLRLGSRVTPRHGVRRALVVAEVALATVLVVGAVFLTKGMRQVLAVDPGFESDGLVTASIQVAGPDFATDSASWRYWGRVQAAVSALPGVSGAALVSQIPMGGNMDSYGVRSESRARIDPRDAISADRYAVTPDYFETMQIPLRSGRYLTAADRGGTDPVVVVSETLAQVYFGNRDPLGERVMVGGGDRQAWRTVVGVVADVRHRGLDQPGSPQIYLPTEQWIFADQMMDLVARTTGKPEGLVAPIRAAVRPLHADPTIEAVRPVAALIGTALARRRLVLTLFGAFALLSLTLAAIGIYGVMASGVAERSRELGVRAALGASTAVLRRSVLRESLSLGALGLLLGMAVAAGLGAALGVGRWGLRVNDPTAFAAATVALGVTVVLAAWIPARRAGLHDPAVTLRAE